MKSISIDQLNNEFAFHKNNSSLKFALGKGDIPTIEIKNEFATSSISLQGAHLLSWVPKAHNDVIWLSTDASFKQGKSVRGGIPICWPWFGAHETNKDYPAHGFARTVFWSVLKTEMLINGETRIVFSLDTSELPDHAQKMWPNKTRAEYSVTIGSCLKLELTTYNSGDHSITIGQALHTYFNVLDITKTQVTGLENKTYLDKPDSFKAKNQVGAIRINSEVDRVYLDTADDVVINNEKRQITISKNGSQSTVVWNPWEIVSKQMGDMGGTGYLKMLCVESANAANDVVTIEVGESHQLSVTYQVELL